MFVSINALWPAASRHRVVVQDVFLLLYTTPPFPWMFCIFGLDPTLHKILRGTDIPLLRCAIHITARCVTLAKTNSDKPTKTKQLRLLSPSSALCLFDRFLAPSIFLFSLPLSSLFKSCPFQVCCLHRSFSIIIYGQ